MLSGFIGTHSRPVIIIKIRQIFFCQNNGMDVVSLNHVLIVLLYFFTHTHKNQQLDAIHFTYKGNIHNTQCVYNYNHGTLIKLDMVQAP